MITSPATAARPWDEIPAGAADLRLVVSDMDGTLLTPDGELPAGFWELMGTLQERGIAFVPASGRQLATLQAMFGPDPASGREGVPSYIAENGTLVLHQGEVVETTPVGEGTTAEVIELVRALNADGAGLGLVRCGVEAAYVEGEDEYFLAEARTYYHRLTSVPDLTAVEGPTLKLAVFDAVDAEATAPAFDRFTASEQVVVSGRHWIDVMSPTVDKGRGVRALQAALDVTPAQTAVFGDYLNDTGLYATADWSFAMADAHPGITELARYIAPGNDERGVPRVLEHLLGLGR
ncbi:HAD-IIB family hydrolase [Brachybacterium sp. J153]|uniref:HAD-IIB family hydrolase n=1 Tax=Brachybacterium sp. J153 TaxID=3116488 RepID=UPI002E760159|nr:HAD-IIB family hydrolase [Brachybacterium sp. J153]MEE1619411.1 HAD-IIB family hydrolase [Brachybacterium sp. J153]